eukprot:4437702-Prymnesium_polylepis.1
MCKTRPRLRIDLQLRIGTSASRLCAAKLPAIASLVWKEIERVWWCWTQWREPEARQPFTDAQNAPALMVRPLAQESHRE